MFTCSLSIISIGEIAYCLAMHILNIQQLSKLTRLGLAEAVNMKSR